MTDSHIPIGDALFAKLTAGTALMALLANGTASVYEDIASEGADEPYVVYNAQSGLPRYTFGALVIEDTLWQVRAVTRGPSSAEAGTIVSEIDNTLNDQALSISGYRQLMTRRYDKVHRTEVIDGERFTHSGHLYRIMVNAT